MSSDTIRVLIVDDEYLVRNLLKKCIDWDSLGMEIIGEAASGNEAIELTDKYKPDLVFTDICMANMDGIQFADYIIKKYPNIKVAVISGYNDFKYAQRGIKAGIKDYILKPIDDEIVKNTALKLKGEIEKDRAVFSEYTSLKKQVIENRPFFVERLLNRLIQPDLDVEEIQRQMTYLDFNFGSDIFQVAVVDIKFTHRGNQAKEVYVSQAMDALKPILRDKRDIHICFDMNYRITIIDNREDNILEEFIEQIKEKSLNKFNVIYSIGLGTRKKGIENIEKSYREALKALERSKGKKPNKLIDDISKYMKQNLGDSELSLTKIAKVFFINPSYLSRIFKKETGTNIMDYLTKLRIEEALLLLKNTDLKAYEIGEKVGVPDSSYFSTCFKKYTGLSVSEYRKM
ncbi:response regulator [Clostridium thermarum]|uniref:response regulator n=1 Tax=Clostridium thermarum TaxID=1716543 RepID=UPI0013D8D0AC|nr:response regulator [Clostridium thermarum]